MITEVERAIVSTHSRPKAAVRITLPLCTPKSFNTQPPEGGWQTSVETKERVSKVSTHSRLKAAGFAMRLPTRNVVCFNTQPPEGGWT